MRLCAVLLKALLNAPLLAFKRDSSATGQTFVHACTSPACGVAMPLVQTAPVGWHAVRCLAAVLLTCPAQLRIGAS
jgi:hypothetical protein